MSSTAPNTRLEVQVDVFFVAFDGTSFVSQAWSTEARGRCNYPNSGLSMVHFNGLQMLSFIDQSSYHEANYGADFLRPSNLSTYIACFEDWYAHSQFGYSLQGMLLSYESLCDAYTTRCLPPPAVEMLIVRMLSAIQRAAAQMGLSYFLICDSVKYLTRHSPTIPMHGSIGVPSSSVPAWRSLLTRLASTSTFFLEQHLEDGSLVHVRYSRHSNVRLVFWAVDVAPDATIEWLPYGIDAVVQPMLRHPPTQLVGLCQLCQACAEPRMEAAFSGFVRNLHSGRCLDRSPGDSPRLNACNATVCYARSSSFC